MVMTTTETLFICQKLYEQNGQNGLIVDFSASFQLMCKKFVDICCSLLFDSRKMCSICTVLQNYDNGSMHECLMLTS